MLNDLAPDPEQLEIYTSIYGSVDDIPSYEMGESPLINAVEKKDIKTIKVRQSQSRNTI